MFIYCLPVCLCEFIVYLSHISKLTSCSNSSPGIQDTINVILLIVRCHGPVIVDVVDNLGRDLHNSVFFFLVELGKFTSFVEHRLDRDLLDPVFFTVSIIIFILADRFTSLPSALSVHVFFIDLNVLCLVLLPLCLRVKQILLSSLLSVFLSFNLALSILFGLTGCNLAAGDVKFAACDGGLQPFKQLAKATVVLLNVIQMDTFDYLLTVDNRLISLHFSLFSLAVHLILHHGLRDLVMLDLSNPFPAELVGVLETDIFTLRANQKHETLDDLRVPHDSIHEQVLDLIDPLLC